MLAKQKRAPLPASEQMGALLDAVALLHGEPPGRRAGALLGRMIELFDADGASVDGAPAGGAAQTLGRTRTGAALAVGRTPRALLGQTRGLSRVVVFTAAELAAGGWRTRRPRGMRDAVYSLAPPDRSTGATARAEARAAEIGTVLGLYFAKPISAEAVVVVAGGLRLLHSSACELLGAIE
ncbi:MAG TPA: hypothetical protein VF624_02955 [Tepidisphaeraceae bacterium]|jgi:hypothetical protein